MPGGIATAPSTPTYFGMNLTLAVQNGSLPESRLDDMVLRVLTPYFYLEQDKIPPLDPSSIDTNIYGPIWPQNTWTHTYNIGGVAHRDVRSNHSASIRELGAAGTVLLKNVNKTLPLKAPKTIGVFGNDAGDLTNGLISLLTGNYEYGTLPVGGGSGSGRFTYVVTPLEAIKARAAKDGALVQYVLNNTQIASGVSLFGAYGVYPIPEVCIVFLKTWATEGYDRTSLLLDWNGTAVVKADRPNAPTRLSSPILEVSMNSILLSTQMSPPFLPHIFLAKKPETLLLISSMVMSIPLESFFTRLRRMSATTTLLSRIPPNSSRLKIPTHGKRISPKVCSSITGTLTLKTSHLSTNSGLD